MSERRQVYLDHAATTPLDPRVAEIMTRSACISYGNPSSLHSGGREARRCLEQARTEVGRCVGAVIGEDSQDKIIFTGGGSEADNVALIGFIEACGGQGVHLVTSSIEHHAILETCVYLAQRGAVVTYLPVDGCGLVDPEALRQALRGLRHTRCATLVSIMHANNEIGVIEPIAELSAIAHEYGCLFHTDAVQTAGHYPLDVRAIDIDLLSISAHKFYGPKGVGALYIRESVPLRPLIHGGSQERGLRAGTENVAGAAGAAAALSLAVADLEQEAVRLRSLRDSLAAQVRSTIPDVRINGHPERRLPNNLNLSFRNVESEALLLHLDRAGIAASMGSACTSESIEPSHVIQALGLAPEWARGAVRFSLGRSTTTEDIGYTAEILAVLASRLRK